MGLSRLAVLKWGS